MSSSSRKSQTSEHELLEAFFRLVKRVKKHPAGVILGVGDDAALIRFGTRRDLILTTDIQVEEVHFKRKWFSGHALGWRLAAINLSDVAAMAGRPLYALLSLAVPFDLDSVYVKGIERGVVDHLGHYGASVIGGNISSTEKHLFCDLTLVGDSPKNKAWTRLCRPGDDAIVVVGTLGSARAGLAILEGVDSSTSFPSLIRAYKRPIPLLEVAELLRSEPAVHGAIDVSDGFSTDVIRICRKSAAGCEIDPEALPIARSLRGFCESRGEDPLMWALKGGEDYALILSVASEKAGRVTDRLHAKLGIQARVVGRFTNCKGRYELIFNGKRERFGAWGWNHFARPA